MQHIYTKDYYAAIKKDVYVLCRDMKMETINLSKLTKEPKTKHHMFSIISES